LLLTAIVAARLGLVAAGLHIAPAAAVILACIEEEPATILGGAGAHVLQPVRGQQIGCGANDLPEQHIQLAFFLPVPHIAIIRAHEASVSHSPGKLSIQVSHIRLWRVFPFGNGVKDAIDGLARIDCTCQRGRSLFRLLLRQVQQAPRLLFSQAPLLGDERLQLGHRPSGPCLDVGDALYRRGQFIGHLCGDEQQPRLLGVPRYLKHPRHGAHWIVTASKLLMTICRLPSSTVKRSVRTAAPKATTARIDG